MTTKMQMTGGTLYEGSRGSRGSSGATSPVGPKVSRPEEMLFGPLAGAVREVGRLADQASETERLISALWDVAATMEESEERAAWMGDLEHVAAGLRILHRRIATAGLRFYDGPGETGAEG